MIIFPGDASFGYVEQAKENKTNNRVYALKFTSTPKKVHFFWMQEPESKRDKDKELADKVNALINGETPAASCSTRTWSSRCVSCALAFLASAKAVIRLCSFSVAAATSAVRA